MSDGFSDYWDFPEDEKTKKVAPRVAKTWDETFMEMAIVASNRSKDPSTQVGACIVSADNKILSLGYNGTPRGWSDEEFPWAREGDPLDTKYPFVVHSERNAVLNYEGSLRDFRGARVYVTHFPCNECTKELAQIGIVEVIWLNDHNLSDFSTRASLKIMDNCGIDRRQLVL